MKRRFTAYYLADEPLLYVLLQALASNRTTAAALADPRWLWFRLPEAELEHRLAAAPSSPGDQLLPRRIGGRPQAAGQQRRGPGAGGVDMSQKEWQRCLQQQLEPVLTAADSGVGLSTYTDMPFGIFLYPPEDEWELRQALRDLVVRLENAGKTVQRLSMAQLLEQSIEAAGSVAGGDRPGGSRPGHRHGARHHPRRAQRKGGGLHSPRSAGG